MDILPAADSRPVIPVTVLIPAYNAARFIGRAVAMLDAQTVRPSEILIVDDGSTDETVAIAVATGVRVLQAPHRGLSATRNAGIAAASNDWIALLDADDVWHPSKLEMQWGICCTNSDARFICTDYDEIDLFGSLLLEDGVLSLRQYRSVASQQILPRTSVLSSDLLARAIPDWGFILPSSVMFHRSLVSEVGGFHPTLKIEDQEFFLRCVRRARVVMIERPLLGYVRHPASVTAASNCEGLELDFCEHVMAHAAEYHPASVVAFRERLPMLLLRFARHELQNGRYASCVRASCRAFFAAAWPPVAFKILAKFAAKNGTIRGRMSAVPGLRQTVALIPGRLADRGRRQTVNPWPALIASADAGRAVQAASQPGR